MSRHSLFSRLFWYRERQGHAPYENMLSDLLVALLKRLPRDTMNDFVERVLLPEAAVDQWRLSSPTWKRVEWLTEVSVPRGRADIVLFAEGIPVLVVENKVNSGIRVHGRSRAEPTEDQAENLTGDLEGEHLTAKNEAEEVLTQLHTYAEWLAAKIKDPDTHGWPGALVLLTHNCRPPTDFSIGSSGKYAVKWRNACRWSEVADWLVRTSEASLAQKEFADGDGDQRPGWMVLAQEMAAFLKDRNMAERKMMKSDLEQVAQHMAEGVAGFSERVENTLVDVVHKVASDVRSLQWDSFGGCFDEPSRALWGWGYLRNDCARPKSLWQFLAIGICYPSASSDWCKAVPPLPAWPHMSVAIGYERNQKFYPWTEQLTSLVPAGWRIVEGGASLHLFVARPQYDFPSEPDDMFGQLAIWATEQVRQVEPLLRAMASAWVLTDGEQ